MGEGSVFGPEDTPLSNNASEPVFFCFFYFIFFICGFVYFPAPLELWSLLAMQQSLKLPFDFLFYIWDHAVFPTASPSSDFVIVLLQRVINFTSIISAVNV